MHMHSIEPIKPDHDLAIVRELFQEYVESLGIDLSFQNIDDELASLPGKYAAPYGTILLARDTGGMVLGCVAVRPLALAGQENACEIKRLYVRPQGRGKGLGLQLAQAALAFARSRHYAAIYLDTLETMTSAKRLYEGLGFTPVDAYYENPVPGALYMSLSLEQKRPEPGSP